MRFSDDPGDVTLFFEAMKVRGIPREADISVWFPALLEELEKIVPGSGLSVKAEDDVIGIAVMRKGQDLPDNRFQRPDRPDATPPTQSAPQGQPGHRTGITAAKLPPGSPIAAKLGKVEMQPLPDGDVEQMRQLTAQSQVPYPTHEGVLNLDGKCDIKVYQLSDGQRIIDLESLQRFFATFGGI